MNIEVTQKADGWMLGTIEGGYEWQAKVYEKPSEFGITEAASVNCSSGQWDLDGSPPL